jgi:predicted peroxiredoxin
MYGGFTLDPHGKRVFIVATFGPDNPERCPAPFLFSQEAAKAGAQVGLCFVLQAPLLLKKGVPEDLYAKPGGRSIRQFIDETLAAGVQLYVCDAAMELCDMTPEDLIDEIDNLVGPSFLITQGLDADLAYTF